MRFQDKVAIVTGGNSGMGKEVARRFVTEGGLVVINGRNAAKTEAAVKEIDPSGNRAIAHIGDIALPATGDAVVKAALDHALSSLIVLASRSVRKTRFRSISMSGMTPALKSLRSSRRSGVTARRKRCVPAPSP
jgi:NAD(P)-dependent dehydrogenase (short-subunit alcohol dehydrogenase family)